MTCLHPPIRKGPIVKSRRLYLRSHSHLRAISSCACVSITRLPRWARKVYMPSQGRPGAELQSYARTSENTWHCGVSVLDCQLAMHYCNNLHYAHSEMTWPLAQNAVTAWLRRFCLCFSATSIPSSPIVHPPRCSISHVDLIDRRYILTTLFHQIPSPFFTLPTIAGSIGEDKDFAHAQTEGRTRLICSKFAMLLCSEKLIIMHPVKRSFDSEATFYKVSEQCTTRLYV